MGFQVGAACYDTAEAAAAAAASAMSGVIVDSGGIPAVVTVDAAASAAITYTFTPATGAPYTLEAPFNPQPCGLLEWGDGMTLGWSVFAAWAAAFGIRFLADMFHGNP